MAARVPIHEVRTILAEEADEKRRSLRRVTTDAIGPGLFDTHSRSRVIFNTDRMAFDINGTTLRGVTSVIKTSFFPDYTHSCAKHVDAEDERRGAASLELKAQSDIKGQQLGFVVDREIRDICNVLGRYVPYHFSISWYLEGRQRDLEVLIGTVPDTDLDKLKVWKRDMLPYTRWFLHAMSSIGLNPIRANIPCGSITARLGTAVDVVAQRSDDVTTNRVVLIEIKCGYDRYLYKYRGFMKHPFESLKDSPFYQFLVQTAFTEALFRVTYPNCRVVQSVVINITKTGVYYFELPNSINVNRDAWKAIEEPRKKRPGKLSVRSRRGKSKPLSETGTYVDGHHRVYTKHISVCLPGTANKTPDVETPVRAPSYTVAGPPNDQGSTPRRRTKTRVAAHRSRQATMKRPTKTHVTGGVVATNSQSIFDRLRATSPYHVAMRRPSSRY